MKTSRTATWLSWLAFAFVALAVLVPLAKVFQRSFQVYVVTLTDGTEEAAVGEVRYPEDGGIHYWIQPDPWQEKFPRRLMDDEVASVDQRLTLSHYTSVLGDKRTLGLLWNSARICFLGVLVAFLLGLPSAFCLFRLKLPGWRVLLALAVAPAILPPFFIALGGAREFQSFLLGLGFHGQALHIANCAVVFGAVLAPFVVLLVGPAWGRVPEGPYEAARLLGGPGAARRHVLIPTLLPAVLGAFGLCFLLAVSDFAVPDLLSFMLPKEGKPAHVFATEVRLQWEQSKNANTGRAVATAAPFLVITLVLLLPALWAMKKSPVFAARSATRIRPRLEAGVRGRLAAYAWLLGVFFISLLLPCLGIASWATGRGETSASGTAADARLVEAKGELFAFEEALDATPGVREQRDRWMKMAVAAAVIAAVMGLLIVRGALRGGRSARVIATVASALPLAIPGIVIGIGTLLLWNEWNVPWVERGIGRSVLLLAGRFLPFALLAIWLLHRGVRQGEEDAARSLGAGSAARAAFVWGPRVLPGMLAGALIVLIMALREFEAVMLLDSEIYPARLYDKIHYSRLADEANLLFLYGLYLLGPALLLALVLGLGGWLRRRSA